MEYTVLHLQTNNSTLIAILIAELSQMGYEGFEEIEDMLKSYIPTNLYNESELHDLLKKYQYLASVNIAKVEPIAQQNWNKVWEDNFQPAIIANRVAIKTRFHELSQVFDYEILIEPEMAFGTGHHETTVLMIAQMLDYSDIFAGHTILDFGCGTGILAILASLLQAKKVLAIDYDELAYQNTQKNIKLNKLNNIEIYTGDIHKLNSIARSQNLCFEVILANVNTTAILASFDILVKKLKAGGNILFSGVLITDIEQIFAKARNYSLKHVDTKTGTEWAMIHFVKE